MRLIVALLVVASVASAGPIVVSGFEPVPTGDADATGNFGGWAFLQDALYHLGANTTNGNQSVAVFRNDADTQAGFSSAFALPGIAFNNPNPDRTRLLGGIDGDVNGVGDWQIGFYDALALNGFLNGGPAAGVSGAYDGGTVGSSPSLATLADVGIIVFFGSLGDALAIDGLAAFAAGGGGIFGIGDGPGSYDWLGALTDGSINEQNMTGSPTQGTHNSYTEPSDLGGAFPNWDFYFIKSDGSPGATSAPEAFGSVVTNPAYTSVIGQTDGGNAAFFGNSVAADPVPEPGTWALMGLGALALWVRRRRTAS